MTHEERNKGILKSLARQHKKDTSSPEAAKRALISAGIMTMDGKLAPRYAPPRRAPSVKSTAKA